MLDLRAFRTDADEARERLARRGDPGIMEALDRALDLDTRRREVISEVEVLKARRNDVSREIGDRKREGEEAADLIADMQRVADPEANSLPSPTYPTAGCHEAVKATSRSSGSGARYRISIAKRVLIGTSVPISASSTSSVGPRSPGRVFPC